MVFSIKKWYQNTKEKDKIRVNTLGRLLHTCTFLPLVMFLIMFIPKNYGWTVFFLFSVIMIFFGYKTEDAVFRLLGKYSFKIIKQPYYYIISLLVIFSFAYFGLGMFH
ncbi:hypothetical protein SAMN04489735_1005121 [Aneurinibacillus thermoaerophilus]|uniref:Uncharacterized protein n=1 Tax=Aneurinibacillus thermoaerophilus TaxID=143495 RepID=A0A1G7Y4Q9_ANETH|nr:hypothetical protein ACH33_08385 [Aneurinibacillus sp. XH2]SDG91404.1 hypothetical protein SAMN04489735_1005121 [Aneurinibacillus thermoaerophilus]